MIREGASRSRPPLLDGSNYAFWKARMRAYLRANNERRIKLSQFPNKVDGHQELEFWIALKFTACESDIAEEIDDEEEMVMSVRKFKIFLKGKRTGGGFKGANAKKDFVPIKFDNDKGKGKGVQCYEC
ncbi:hypothetical protein ACOSQ3_021436 [Xanthoceras sorbifolium]